MHYATRRMTASDYPPDVTQPPMYRGWIKYRNSHLWQAMAVGQTYDETMGGLMAACGGLFADKLVLEGHRNPNDDESNP